MSVRATQTCLDLPACLSAFTDPEILFGGNSFECAECTRKFLGGDQDMLKVLQKEVERNMINLNVPEVDIIPKVTLYYMTLKNVPIRPKNFPTEKEREGSDKPSQRLKLLKKPATKQYLLEKLPPILTFHFKRFKATWNGVEKVSTVVRFPDTIDMSSYIQKPGNWSYRLRGTVEHSGGIAGGHYIACIKKRLSFEGDVATEPEGVDRWFYFSDSQFHETSATRALDGQAYLLFYEKE
eukprot:TRINITY_DN4984_c0_g1_i1.p1 TRINITY_DN4984_c0_g1~~TRINITY_DN4984_c0_g1_i1.p1  ORF type:complete len:238 (-),score=50.65 TRINITY_DN4984_c0_g1_i1:17-730(-)